VDMGKSTDLLHIGIVGEGSRKAQRDLQGSNMHACRRMEHHSIKGLTGSCSSHSPIGHDVGKAWGRYKEKRSRTEKYIIESAFRNCVIAAKRYLTSH
jgi:hypothetical protein